MASGGWLDTLKTAWPYLVAIAGAAWAVIRFGAAENRQNVKDQDEREIRDAAAQDRAHALAMTIQQEAAKIAADAQKQAIESLKQALERANVEIAQSRQDRAAWADTERQLRDELAAEREARRGLAKRVDELAKELADERERHRQREEHLNGEVRQRDQIIASMKKAQTK